jgi:cytochrome c peroxidase
MNRRSTQCLAAALLGLGALTLGQAMAALPISLDQVPVPEPVNLDKFVKDKPAAVRLGKALFWDMQLGSDGSTACASCHFHAGADDRARNTLAPGPDLPFGEGGRPNSTVALGDFPFHRLQDPDDRTSPVTRDRNDVVGSQGIVSARFQEAAAGSAVERGRVERGGIFSRNARGVRQVTGRNAPSVINAVFNLANFWDGRAHPNFNGVNPFGILDHEARVLINGAAGLEPLNLTGDLATNPYALNNASLASQAVGPPLSDVEMSFAGRSWPDIGRKMLSLKPLVRQRVHPADSVLGGALASAERGLETTYADMVRAAFRDELWNATETADGFTQMEANFSLFFGLAVQLYEATLVSDDTPFDRFIRGDPRALTERQIRGMNLFFSGGTSCAFCHTGPEFTAASITQTMAPGEPGLIELMPMANGAMANYDIGFYNIGVRPTGEDLGRGARVTLNDLDLPLSFTGQHFQHQVTPLPFTPLAQPGCVTDFFGDPPNICPLPFDPVSRQAVNGAFKVPGLRNVELTGPYMHNGGMATLMQVVEFYVRGGDFHDENIDDLDPIIDVIGGMQGDEAKQEELVDFLLALTDERVRWERAPFDHPQLFVPDGHREVIEGDPKRTRKLPDRVREIPAVGSAGRGADGLPPVKPFLADELTGSQLTQFHFQH